MSTNISNTQKKELAKILYTKENLTQAEIAERVGTSRVTIGKWIKNENWEMLKVSITITKEEQLKNLYRQLAELNDVIAQRPVGERFPSAGEADTISKLANAIKKMETEVGLGDIVSVLSELLKWIRTFDLDKTKELAPLFDSFVKSKLQ
ncbi:MAG: helix-turn-helix domain-containing protein [Phocaeicola sp.]